MSILCCIAIFSSEFSVNSLHFAPNSMHCSQKLFSRCESCDNSTMHCIGWQAPFCASTECFSDMQISHPCHVMHLVSTVGPLMRPSLAISIVASNKPQSIMPKFLPMYIYTQFFTYFALNAQIYNPLCSILRL